MHHVEYFPGLQVKKMLGFGWEGIRGGYAEPLSVLKSCIPSGWNLFIILLLTNIRDAVCEKYGLFQLGLQVFAWDTLFSFLLWCDSYLGYFLSPWPPFLLISKAMQIVTNCVDLIVNVPEFQPTPKKKCRNFQVNMKILTGGKRQTMD